MKITTTTASSQLDCSQPKSYKKLFISFCSLFSQQTAITASLILWQFNAPTNDSGCVTDLSRADPYLNLSPSPPPSQLSQIPPFGALHWSDRRQQQQHQILSILPVETALMATTKWDNQTTALEIHSARRVEQHRVIQHLKIASTVVWMYSGALCHGVYISSCCLRNILRPDGPVFKKADHTLQTKNIEEWRL